jgi:DNA (cytosine-5)-methyltransferase 1
MPIPIIDLFAGPGGLGEGFSSVLDGHGTPAFRIGLSIEKEASAHKTLTLRSVYRLLKGTPAIEHYYAYARGEISAAEFKSIPAVATAFVHASTEARAYELGKTSEIQIDAEISAVLKGRQDWLLIGGPPCQAYSLAGRARRKNDVNFQSDEKHFLYMEYLRIIRVHKPAVFVMENVKGLLTSKHSGAHMFDRILADLSCPELGTEYEIRSFTKTEVLAPEDYVIETERFGIPQTRHRIILFGVRKGLGFSAHALLQEMTPQVGVKEAIGDLPRIRSRLSRTEDTLENWRSILQNSAALIEDWDTSEVQKMVDCMDAAANSGRAPESSGSNFFPYPPKRRPAPQALANWVIRPDFGGVSHHESRAHMDSDLSRYLFAASFTKLHGRSPRLGSYPPALLPDHKNAVAAEGKTSIPFKDRFRVQCENEPSSTIVSHIAKDGHYYIHYDPSQCRSLTVREAARLQTFPDDYFFEGNRTERYTQVGNAVPPLLAYKLGLIVFELMKQRSNTLEEEKEIIRYRRIPALARQQG